MLVVKMKDGRRLTLAEYHAIAVAATNAASTLDELQQVKTVMFGKDGFYPRLFKVLNA